MARRRGGIFRSEAFHRLSASALSALTGLAQRLGPDRSRALVRWLCRLVGPLLPEHRTAKRNIAAAFPDKSETERAAILRGCWENFADVAVEFVFLEDIADGYDPENPTTGAVTVAGTEHFVALRDDGRPAVIVAAHLANWEVLGVVSNKFGLKTVLPFKAPANIHLARDVLATRERLMGKLVGNNRGASIEIGGAMAEGAHLGMLVDQRPRRGIEVPFFGRPALANPMPARFARQFDCPVHGARAIRKPGGRLHLELTPEIEMPRDAEGLIDVDAATARINQVIEGWVREHPEQYFWLHDRWRA